MEITSHFAVNGREWGHLERKLLTDSVAYLEYAPEVDSDTFYAPLAYRVRVTERYSHEKEREEILAQGDILEIAQVFNSLA